jgi:putative membrane protein
MRTIKNIMLTALTMFVVQFMSPNSLYAQENPSLSDAEVAHIAVVANQIDIYYAAIAKDKSKNKDVLQFAETMANDHTAVMAQAKELVTKLGVTPKDNAVSQKLLSDAEKIRVDLKSLPAKKFDKAYIDNEVGYHKAVIAAVRDLLIPETENQELKELLEGVLSALDIHLEHALMVQKKL